MAPRKKRAVKKVKVARTNPTKTIADTVPIEEHFTQPVGPSATPSANIKCHRRASLDPELERS